jgi:hypothetical protein
MAESSGTPASSRPRTALFGLMAVAVAGLLAYVLWPAAAKPAGPSNSPREQRKQASAQKETSGTERPGGSLDVGLDTLKQPPVAPEEKGRNPFRFYVPPPPPPPPPPRVPQVGDKDYKAPPPQPPPLPPGPPPIPLKFIGTLEVKGRKVAVFVNTDGHGMPQYAAEGELVLGQYRVVKIGVESVTVEYLDGRGRQTIPMRG